MSYEKSCRLERVLYKKKLEISITTITTMGYYILPDF